MTPSLKLVGGYQRRPVWHLSGRNRIMLHRLLSQDGSLVCIFILPAQGERVFVATRARIVVGGVGTGRLKGRQTRRARGSDLT